MVYIILFLYAYIQAAVCKNRCALCKENISLYNATGISYDAARKMQEMNEGREKQYNFVVWGEKEEISISNAELMKSEEVTLLTVCGDTDIICESKTSLKQNDSQGCLMDTSTAYSVFGSEDITNQNILIEGKQYTVRGMITDMANIIIVESGEKEQIFNRITIKAKGKNINGIADNFKNTFGTEGILMDFAFLYDIFNLISLVVPFAILLYVFAILGKIRKKYITRKKQHCLKKNVIENFFKIYSWKYWILFVLQIFLIGFGLMLILKRLSFMEIYLPTKWSDFAYWNMFFEERKEVLYNIFRMQKAKIEINFYLSIYQAFFYYMLAFFFSVFIITNIKNMQEFIRKTIFH